MPRKKKKPPLDATCLRLPKATLEGLREIAREDAVRQGRSLTWCAMARELLGNLVLDYKGGKKS